MPENFETPVQTLLPGVLGMAVYTDCAYLKALHERANAIRGLDVSSLRLHLYTLNFAQLIAHSRAAEWRAAEAMMIDAAVQLERAGADFLVVTSNTGSSFAHNVADRIPLPILSIADTTSKAARTAGAHRLGVLSTIRTCESGLFQKAGSGFDVEFLAPRPDIAAAIDRLIFDELITGRVTQSGVGTVLDAIDSFRDMGADGIALACTDLTHLVPSLKGRTSLPLFDTTVLHAEAAAEIALGLRTL